MKPYLKVLKYFNRFIDDYENNLMKVNSQVVKNYCETIFNKFMMLNGISYSNHLIWNYNICKSEFKLMSSKLNFNNLADNNFKKFFSLIKPNYIPYFSDIIIAYYSFIYKKSKDVKDNYTLQIEVPLQLSINEYWMCVLYIKPIVIKDIIIELNLIADPIKVYKEDEKSNYLVLGSIIKNSNQHKENNYKNINAFSLNDLQKRVYGLLLQNYNKSIIAKKLGNDEKYIIGICNKIKLKMASYYNCDFRNVYEAIFYFQSIQIDNNI